MNDSRLILTVAAILVWAAPNVAAQRTFEVYKTFSGSSAPIAMDLNDDGLPAIRAIGGGPAGPVPTPVRSRSINERNPSKGNFTADNVSEAVLLTEPTGRCAVGEFEFEMIHYSSVQRYANGDLLIAKLIDGFTCFNLLTRRGYGTVRTTPTGGTGRFEGAQGELVRVFEGRALDPSGLRSTFTATETGTLILPD